MLSSSQHRHGRIPTVDSCPYSNLDAEVCNGEIDEIARRFTASALAVLLKFWPGPDKRAPRGRSVRYSGVVVATNRDGQSGPWTRHQRAGSRSPWRYVTDSPPRVAGSNAPRLDGADHRRRARPAAGRNQPDRFNRARGRDHDFDFHGRVRQSRPRRSRGCCRTRPIDRGGTTSGSAAE